MADNILSAMRPFSATSRRKLLSSGSASPMISTTMPAFVSGAS